MIKNIFNKFKKQPELEIITYGEALGRLYKLQDRYPIIITAYGWDKSISLYLCKTQSYISFHLKKRENQLAILQFIKSLESNSNEQHNNNKSN